jgi:MFS family permease
MEYVLMGFVLAIIRIISSPIPFISGWLSDIYNRKKVIVFSLIVRIPLFILISRLQLYPTLVVIGVNSIISGFAFPVINTSVQDIVKKEKAGTALGFVNTLAQIGSFVGPLLASFILEYTESYILTFDIGAFLVLLSIIFILMTN